MPYLQRKYRGRGLGNRPLPDETVQNQTRSNHAEGRLKSVISGTAEDDDYGRMDVDEAYVIRWRNNKQSLGVSPTQRTAGTPSFMMSARHRRYAVGA